MAIFKNDIYACKDCIVKCMLIFTFHINTTSELHRNLLQTQHITPVMGNVLQSCLA